MSTGPSRYAIRAHALTKKFSGPRRGSPPVLAADAVTLAVASGSVSALLGPNGAGKTTTFRMLTTLLTPDSGHATVAGCDLRAEPGAVRQRIGLVGQLGGADPEATGHENLILAARLYGLSRDQAQRRTEELEDIFDLAAIAGRLAGTYSGGQRRRLELALGLVHRPQVLFLDEPTTGLDPQNRARLWQEVRQLRDQGATVMLTTHYLEEADALADNVCVMDHGRVITTGSPAELKAAHGADSLDQVFLELTGRPLRDTGAVR
ncbi:MAG: ATP-binding cassette domain-containing protein [Propionibacteriaceae bacterium]|jgi:ABC-2 type transport system ATP-binding protein|nr:ATP-binding cassette domain-containing protein [Propionibacteriaceae bacterium]